MDEKEVPRRGAHEEHGALPGCLTDCREQAAKRATTIREPPVRAEAGCDLSPIVTGEELLRVYGGYRERIEAKAEEMSVSLAWDEPPEVIRRTPAQYPQSAFVTKTEGTVLAMFVIDDRGRVSEVEVLESHEGLDEAAAACVQTWRFKPARKEGRPVGTLAVVAVAFRIY
jgi:TonB family protein